MPKRWLKMVEFGIPFRFQKGHIPWNKGKHYKIDKKRPDVSIRMKLNNPMKNPETVKKIAEASSRNFKGRKLSAEWIRKSLRRRTPSSLEQKMIQIIKKFNLPYKFVGDGKFFIERKNPDFINCNGQKIAIEVYCRKFKTKLNNLNIEQWKQERQDIFNRYDWKILFFDETQINEKFILKTLGGD